MIRFAGLEFKGLTREVLLREEGFLKIIVTVNAELIVLANEDERFKRLINANYATFDGQVPYLLARLKCRGAYFEKISGSDFIYDACEFARKHVKRVFLLGGYTNSNRLAVERLKKEYDIEIEGFSPEHRPYPFDAVHNARILERLSSFGPHILFVGFGAKKQEFWIEDNKKLLKNIGVRWAVGSGGTFEMVSGQFRRASRFLQNVGLEGVYRMCKEPSLYRLKKLLNSIKMFRYLF
ncbi:MAG: WecB/TagA/CpsF family glycosyltransferase [Nitrospirota bacterium]